MAIQRPSTRNSDNSNGAPASRSNRRLNRNNNDKLNANFHPKLISAQIVAIQCLHYALMAFLIQINHVIYGTSITVDRIFTDKHIRVWHSSGWPDVLAIWLASIVGAVLLAIIVEKSKKCLDFGVTLFLLHLLLCVIYDGLPLRPDWWIVHITGTLIMILLGEYLCSRRELDEIPLLQL